MDIFNRYKGVSAASQAAPGAGAGVEAAAVLLATPGVKRAADGADEPEKKKKHKKHKKDKEKKSKNKKHKEAHDEEHDEGSD